MNDGNLARDVLGALRVCPRLFEASDVSADDFPAGEYRDGLAAISSLWEENRPEEIDPEILIQRLGGNGSGPFVASLIDGQVRIEPEIFRARVLELRRRTITRRIVAKIERQAKAGEIDLDEVRGDLRRYDELRGANIDPGSILKSGAALQALDLRVEYLVDKFIPETSVTVLHSRGGLGKTWACLELARSISEGEPFYSQPTKTRSVVYVDFENPLPTLIERARKLDIRKALFWHQSFEPRPPKLDSDGYGAYKSLPPHSLIIFDTLRAAHDLDENDSKDMAPIMGRLKEIRDAGFTVLVIHHAGKGNDRASKGSTAITDLADHVLSLYRVRRSTFKEIEDDNEANPDDLFRLGTGEKTRYEPFQLFLKRSETGAFVLADDPDQETLQALSEFIQSAGHALNQTEIFTWAKGELEIGKKQKLVSLLRRGENRLWISTKIGVRRTYVSL